MGYTTTFKGQLKFKNELNGKQLAKVKSFFGEDCREHPDWNCDGTYIDLRFTDDFSGIEWDDSTEKNNGMVEHVNLIIAEMKKEYPDFELEGKLLAQGEDFEDRWMLVIENGIAVERKVEIVGTKVTCPHCGEKFVLEAISKQ
jgi:hypothetical protein